MFAVVVHDRKCLFKVVQGQDVKTRKKFNVKRMKMVCTFSEILFFMSKV